MLEKPRSRGGAQLRDPFSNGENRVFTDIVQTHTSATEEADLYIANFPEEHRRI